MLKNKIEITTVSIEKAIHDRLIVVTEQRGVKLYRLLGDIINEWLDGQKDHSAANAAE